MQWADDKHWVPHLLAGDMFRGYFLFRGHEVIVDGVFQVVSEEADIVSPVHA